MIELAQERVPYPRRIYCNRNLRMDRIRVVGFDMDYTLARYTQDIEHLQAEMVLHRLVEVWGYPRDVLACRYDPDFAIRGLAVAMKHGDILKMDAHRFVGRVWHGPGPLDPEIRRHRYTNKKVSPADSDMVMVDTLFSLPEISLYAQLVDHFEEEASRPTWDKLWRDLRNAMDSLHRDGTLKAVLQSDLERYIAPDPALPETLHRFRSAGKKLFILTNSEPHYTEAVMGLLLDGRYKGYDRWQDYFDFVLTRACKPAFFSSDAPFLEVEPGGSETDRVTTELRRGRVYTGGNFLKLARLTGMMGDDVLYVGDHIYGDILRSKIHTHWRTAMVVQEMEDELAGLQAHRSKLSDLDELELRRAQLDLERAALALDGERDKALRDEVRFLVREIARVQREVADAFNPHWGFLFRDRAERSAFGEQVEKYACVYTSRVTNFRLYSPQWYFRSPRARMAHELLL